MNRPFMRRCVVALAAVGLGVAAGGQARPPVNASPYPPMANTNGRSTSDPSGMRTPGMDFPPMLDPNFTHRQLIARREEAKKRMSENASRLLTLTRSLQADLQGREATEEDAKRLDEIAKLAHTVRDQMRQ